MLARDIYDSFVNDFKLGDFSYVDGKLLKHVRRKNQHMQVKLDKPIPAAIPCAQGYRRIYYNGKYIKEHRLVFAVIHGVDELLSYQCIDHINGIKSDNRIENLRGLSIKENTKAAEKLGNFKRTYGELNGCCKLTKSQVARIRKLYDVGMTQYKLAEMFGVSQGHISVIVNNKKRLYA